VLVASNPACTQTSVFQVTGLTNQTTPGDTDNFDTILHDTSASVQPGNCTADLFGTFDCSSSGDAQTGVFRPGSVVSRFAVHAYFVTAGDSPTLIRKRLGLVNGQICLITEELIRNVEDFQVLYGRDTVNNSSLSVDDYVTADRVTDWEQVVSVRFLLLLRSQERNIRTEAASLTYEKLVNADIPASGRISTAPTDRRLRRVVGSVVALRNSKYVP
jgi:type IV pilus assembly protein PilW